MAVLTPTTQSTGSQQTHGTQEAQARSQNNPANVMALTYYYLIEAATTRTESALVDSKQIKANGYKQEQLDKEAAALKWNYVPKEKQSVHWKTYMGKTPYHTWAVRGGGEVPERVTYYKKKKTKIVTVKNEVTIANVEAKNQQVVADRQELSQRMSVLQ